DVGAVFLRADADALEVDTTRPLPAAQSDDTRPSPADGRNPDVLAYLKGWGEGLQLLAAHLDVAAVSLPTDADAVDLGTTRSPSGPRSSTIRPRGRQRWRSRT